MNITDSQRAMLEAIARHGGVDGLGWAEVELEFLSRRTSHDFPARMESGLCKRVGDGLRRKGLIADDGEPCLTDAGRAALEIGR